MKLVTSTGQRQSIEIAPKSIGGGFEAKVYEVPALRGCAAKIYQQTTEVAEAHRVRLEAMLAHPPQTMWVMSNGRKLPLIAWPTHLIESDDGGLIGFLMANVPKGDAPALSAFFSRQAMEMNRLSSNDRSLPTRLSICRNLAGVAADLHRQGHCIIDLKPQNVHVFRDHGVPCILDTDSFQINSPGREAFRATAFTIEYACPELLGRKSADIPADGDLQDRFALAVLIFQVMNGGIHPYQGITTVERENLTYDQAIPEGLYAYGLNKNPDIRPTPRSNHDSLPVAMRELFDRAFQAESPAARPSANEWKDYLAQILRTPETFSACEVHPTEVLHIHFANMPCPECRSEPRTSQKIESTPLESGRTQPMTPRPQSDLVDTSAARPEAVTLGTKATSPDSVSSGNASTTPSQTAQQPSPERKVSRNGPDQAAPHNAGNQPPLPARKSFRKVLGIIVVLAIAALMMFFFVGRSKNETSRFIGDSSIVPAPTVSTAAGAAAATAVVAAPTEPELISAEMKQAALGVASRDNQIGMSARQAILQAAVRRAVEANQNDLRKLIQQAATNDADIAQEAVTMMRNTSAIENFAGWRRIRDVARKINEYNRLNFSDGLARAIETQSNALALDPFDREIAGNLAYFLALNRDIEKAHSLGIYSLSLPRNPNETGRSTDWQLVGSTFAMAGDAESAFGAYAVAISLTTKLAGLCQSLLYQQSKLGDTLKAPIDRAFRRVGEKVSAVPEECVVPVQWKSS